MIYVTQLGPNQAHLLGLSETAESDLYPFVPTLTQRFQNATSLFAKFEIFFPKYGGNAELVIYFHDSVDVNYGAVINEHLGDLRTGRFNRNEIEEINLVWV